MSVLQRVGSISDNGVERWKCLSERTEAEGEVDGNGSAKVGKCDGCSIILHLARLRQTLTRCRGPRPSWPSTNRHYGFAAQAAIGSHVSAGTSNVDGGGASVHRHTEAEPPAWRALRLPFHLWLRRDVFQSLRALERYYMVELGRTKYIRVKVPYLFQIFPISTMTPEPPLPASQL